MSTEQEVEELATINAVTDRIISCAIEVHRQLRPGLLEQTYETAMCVELTEAGVAFERQAAFPVIYKGSQNCSSTSTVAFCEPAFAVSFCRKVQSLPRCRALCSLCLRGYVTVKRWVCAR
jgi:hypothetical protein